LTIREDDYRMNAQGRINLLVGGTFNGTKKKKDSGEKQTEKRKKEMMPSSGLPVNSHRRRAEALPERKSSTKEKWGELKRG